MLKRLLLWKYFIAVVVILGCCVYVSRKDQEARDEYEQKCSQFNASALPPSGHQEDCDKGAEDAARHLPRWYRVFSWPEGMTTWAILLTLLVIAEQTNQTKRAALATEESVGAIRRQTDIQAAGMRQWVDVEVLGCRPAKRHFAPKNPKFAVDISFEAVNNTANVLTVRKIETIVDMTPDESEVFIVETNVDLSPDKSSENNRYPFFISSQSIRREWFEKGTIITINGSVTFDDCLGKQRSEYFGGVYECSDGRIVKLKALGIVPERSVEKGLRVPRMEGWDQPQKD